MHEVVVWWASLSAVSVVNLCLWAYVARRRGGDRQQMLLSAIFVFVCAYRSFWPRAEAPRFCLFDTWIASAALARIAATFAELAFTAQIALVLRHLAQAANARLAERISYLLVPLIAMAEIFSWYSAVTGNFLGSVLEESTWALTYGLTLTAFATLPGRFSPWVDRAIRLAVALGSGYVLFMVSVDVPMYWRRYLHDQAAGGNYLSIADGWRDAWERRVVTWRLQDWREEMPWMTLYFSVAVWISIAILWASRFRDGLVAVRQEKIAEVSQRTPAPAS